MRRNKQEHWKTAGNIRPDILICDLSLHVRVQQVGSLDFLVVLQPEVKQPLFWLTHLVRVQLVLVEDIHSNFIYEPCSCSHLPFI